MTRERVGLRAQILVNLPAMRRGLLDCFPGFRERLDVFAAPRDLAFGQSWRFARVTHRLRPISLDVEPAIADRRADGPATRDMPRDRRRPPLLTAESPGQCPDRPDPGRDGPCWLARPRSNR